MKLFIITADHWNGHEPYMYPVYAKRMPKSQKGLAAIIEQAYGEKLTPKPDELTLDWFGPWESVPTYELRNITSASQEQSI